MEWRTIPGFEGRYEVSDEGKVRSLSRKFIRSNGWPMSIKGREISQWLCEGERLTVTLLKLDGSKCHRMVHCLVAEVFIGPRPENLEVCHNDGNNKNNRKNNLRYDTKEANEKDKLEHGTSNRGTQNGHNKLTEQQVIAIKKAIKAGEVQANIAKEYNISQSAVSKIAVGKMWEWLNA